MTIRNTIFVAIGLTLGTAVTGGYWALSPFIYWPTEILGDYDPVALIRSLFPIHIVDPSWIHAAKDDLDMVWCFAEFKARAVIVLFGWMAVLIAFFIWVRHTRSAIKAVQAMGGDARA